jgi:hypothetical protein
VKCSVCDLGLGAVWFSIAARYPSGDIHVMNAHPDCLDRVISKPRRRALDHALFKTGWVQETLPVGI